MLTGVALPLAGGVLALFAGAEALVRGSSALARRAGISPLVVGLTVVAFGTSAPELVVSVRAALAGSGDVALGNVVGSNIANVGLILGLAALTRPLLVQARVIRLDAPLTVAASIVLAALLLDGRLGRVAGLGLVVGLAAYVALSYALALRERERAVLTEFERGVAGPSSGPFIPLAGVVAGLALLAGGAELVVRGAVRLAAEAGVSEAVIGLTVVAVGTSLPELATSVVAATRGEADLAVGNVVGSNMFNLLGILGASALVRPLAAPGIDPVDWGVMIAAAGVLALFAATGRRLTRAEGGVLLAGYAAYLALRVALVGA